MIFVNYSLNANVLVLNHFKTFWIILNIFPKIRMTLNSKPECSLQVQQGGKGSAAAKYSGPVDVAKSLYREGGLRSIYKGTVATLLRGKKPRL